MIMDRILKAKSAFWLEHEREPTHVLLSTDDYEQLKEEHGNLGFIAGLRVIETDNLTALAFVQTII